MSADISAIEAQQNIEDAMAEFAPGKTFVLSSLKPVRSVDERWILRAKERGAPTSYVCKTSSSSSEASGRLQRQFARQAEVKLSMKSDRFTVPEPFKFNAKHCVFIMEDAKGQSVADWLAAQTDTEKISRLFFRAGCWLSEFHSPDKRVRELNPDPQWNWLQKTIQLELTGTTPDREGEQLLEHLGELKALAEGVRGLPTIRAITHRDFHTGNLVAKRNGALCGIDFENSREDEAFRDILSFLLDAMARCLPTGSKLTQYDQFLQSFGRGYGLADTDEMVIIFLQRAFGLNELRRIQKSGKLSPMKLKKRDLLWQIVQSTSPIV